MENIFGKNLKHARKRLKLSQNTFAKPLGIKGSFISDIERGKALPSESVIKLIEIKYRINRIWLESAEGSEHIDASIDALIDSKSGALQIAGPEVDYDLLENARRILAQKKIEVDILQKLITAVDIRSTRIREGDPPDKKDDLVMLRMPSC
jgi:transcriptional regulator with XRE-family HTH domain